MMRRRRLSKNYIYKPPNVVTPETKLLNHRHNENRIKKINFNFFSSLSPSLSSLLPSIKLSFSSYLLSLLIIYQILLFSGQVTANDVDDLKLNNGKFRKIYSQSLKLEFCENCNIFIGGLFPIHAPKYMHNAIKEKSEYAVPDELTIDVTSNISEYSTSDNENENDNHNDINDDKRRKRSVEFINYNENKNTQTSDVISKRSVMDEFHYDQNEYICGEIKKERGIQRLEAMMYAIDLINADPNLLPNMKLGARVYDTCDRDSIAMEKCINFISDNFLLNDKRIEEDFTCQQMDSRSGKYKLLSGSNIVPIKKKDVIYKRKVIGVIGAASSSVSIQVANILRLFQVPQISYASTGPELSNKERFPYFSRVLPSDTLQAEAMATLVHDLEWNYVATLHEAGNLGGIEAFVKNAKAKSKENY
jgi:hypothetical protein